jgi:hypothetical protein
MVQALQISSGISFFQRAFSIAGFHLLYRRDAIATRDLKNLGFDLAQWTILALKVRV